MARYTQAPRLAAMLAVALVAACSSDKSSTGGVPPTFEGKPPSGFVDMNEVQVAYIGSAGGGSGTLTFRGGPIPSPSAASASAASGFRPSMPRARSTTWRECRTFPAPTAQGRYGAVAGTASVGDLWLENPNGVVMHLEAKREGLMLSLGGDAVVVTMSQ